MNAKNKAFLYNFLSFGLIFITIRLFFNYFYPEMGRFVVMLISGISAVFFAPRFAAFSKEGREVVLMKWIFLKGVREV